MALLAACAARPPIRVQRDAWFLSSPPWRPVNRRCDGNQAGLDRLRPELPQPAGALLRVAVVGLVHLRTGSPRSAPNNRGARTRAWRTAATGSSAQHPATPFTSSRSRARHRRVHWPIAAAAGEGLAGHDVVQRRGGPSCPPPPCSPGCPAGCQLIPTGRTLPVGAIASRATNGENAPPKHQPLTAAIVALVKRSRRHCHWSIRGAPAPA